MPRKALSVAVASIPEKRRIIRLTFPSAAAAEPTEPEPDVRSAGALSTREESAAEPAAPPASTPETSAFVRVKIRTAPGQSEAQRAARAKGGIRRAVLIHLRNRERDERIARLRKDGLTLSKIAAAIGLSLSSVHAVVTRQRKQGQAARLTANVLRVKRG